MQLHYNCIHDVTTMLLIVIHLLKSNMWHYEFFLTYKLFFRNIDLHCSLLLLMMAQNCDMWHNIKKCYMAY